MKNSWMEGSRTMALLKPLTFYLFRGKEKVIEPLIDKEELNDLVEAATMRQQASQMEADAEALKKAANALASEIMEKYELTGLLLEGHGLLKCYTNKSTFYSKDRIAKSLLEQGVDGDIVKKAIEAGKSTSSKPGTISWDPKIKELK